MQHIPHLLVLVAACSITVGVRAAQPTGAEKERALNAATGWVAILDSRNFTAAAGAGFAEEWFARMNFPKQEDKVASIAAILAQPRTANGCNCGIRDGDFFAFTYDMKYTWTSHGLRGIKYWKQGTEVLYMLLEKDGTWKPAAMSMQLSGNLTH
jgi:hypothetical protein